MSDRPAIPRALERQVLVEAGHRCAIPTCRMPITDIHHIIPFEDVQEHKFENLIVLCPNCHRLYHCGKIDKKSMLIYKANLSILNNRYGELVRRILSEFIDNKDQQTIILPPGFSLFVKYLIRDGILEIKYESPGFAYEPYMRTKDPYVEYGLTAFGKEFISKMIAAEILE